jgi:hypothetical protein
VLTDKSTELVDMLIVMVGWGDKWLAGKAGRALRRHHRCGEISHVDLHCAPAEDRCTPAMSDTARPRPPGASA